MTENERRADRDHRAADLIKERFFYHNFPRQELDGDEDHLSDMTIKRGLARLTGIAKIGLLLTPERWSVEAEPVDGGPESESIPIYQTRVCFTAIRPHELRLHAELFGPFSLEFDMRVLRRMGATPVIYVPRTVGSVETHEIQLDYSGTAVSMIHRLVEARSTLERLNILREKCLQQSGPGPLELNVNWSSRSLTIQASTDGVIDVINLVEDGIRHPDILRSNIDGFASFMYPSEDLGSDNLLEYFQEREWRITTAFVRASTGTGLHSKLTPEEKMFLLEMAPGYFGKIIEMRDGETRRVDACRVIRLLDGQSVFDVCRRVIVPAKAEAAAKQMLPARTKITIFENLPG